jgi:hypothetical protein
MCDEDDNIVEESCHSEWTLEQEWTVFAHRERLSWVEYMSIIVHYTVEEMDKKQDKYSYAEKSIIMNPSNK